MEYAMYVYIQYCITVCNVYVLYSTVYMYCIVYCINGIIVIADGESNPGPSSPPSPKRKPPSSSTTEGKYNTQLREKKVMTKKPVSRRPRSQPEPNIYKRQYVTSRDGTGRRRNYTSNDESTKQNDGAHISSKTESRYHLRFARRNKLDEMTKQIKRTNSHTSITPKKVLQHVRPPGGNSQPARQVRNKRSVKDIGDLLNKQQPSSSPVPAGMGAPEISVVCCTSHTSLNGEEAFFGEMDKKVLTSNNVVVDLRGSTDELFDGDVSNHHAATSLRHPSLGSTSPKLVLYKISIDPSDRFCDNTALNTMLVSPSDSAHYCNPSTSTLFNAII